MDESTQAQAQLARLRKWRNTPDRYRGLSFIRDDFKQRVELPHKQVASIVDAWTRCVPPDLAADTRLESLRRGTLTVRVNSSAALHALDRLVRQGLDADLRAASRCPALTRIRLRRG